MEAKYKKANLKMADIIIKSVNNIKYLELSTSLPSKNDKNVLICELVEVSDAVIAVMNGTNETITNVSRAAVIAEVPKLQSENLIL